MDLKSLMCDKFNASMDTRDTVDIDVSVAGDLYCLCVHANHKMLYYQVYKHKMLYCGDSIFEPIRNEFGDGTVFTTTELKAIFNVDCNDVEDYHLERLFASAISR